MTSNFIFFVKRAVLRPFLSLAQEENRYKGFFYALGGIFLLSTNYITAKYGLRGFDSNTFSLIWTSAAAVYAFIWVAASVGVKRAVVPVKLAGKLLLLGVITGIGMVLSWAGLSLLDPSFNSFLTRFVPVLTILWSVIILKEKVGFGIILPFVIMVGGSLICSLGRWHIVGNGVILTLMACFVVSLQMLIAKIIVRKIHPNILVLYRTFFGALTVMLWLLITGEPNFDVELKYWAVTLLGAFLGPCASFMLTYRSYKYWDLSKYSIVITLQPLFVLPLAYLFLGQFPHLKEFLGGMLIMGGGFWLAWMYFKPLKKQDGITNNIDKEQLQKSTGVCE